MTSSVAIVTGAAGDIGRGIARRPTFRCCPQLGNGAEPVGGFLVRTMSARSSRTRPCLERSPA